MAHLIQHIVEEPRPCSYLSDTSASLEHRIQVDTTPEEFESMLVRGWRRFGPDYFRPSCGGCRQCVPIRIPIAGFAPSKSQRRALRNIGHLRVVVGPPAVDDARLELYHRWHAFREDEREWAAADLDAESYFLSFAFPHPCAREVAYYDEGPGGRPRLVGVGICDETESAWSAVYFYYDPDYARLSPGVANVVFQAELARARGLSHLYLGYYVAGSRSMGYKARFRPSERLVGYPEPDEEPRWIVQP